MQRSSKRERQVPKSMTDYIVGHTAAIIKKTKHAVQQHVVKTMEISGMDAADYLPSPLDRVDLVMVKPVNLLEAFNGQGLFAKQNIPARTCIGEYTGVRYTQDAYAKLIKRNKKLNVEYAVNVDEDVVVDGVLKGNYTRYINFSDVSANVEFTKHTIRGEPIVKLMTTRAIQAGEQLLADYNVSQYAESEQVYYFLNPSDDERDAFTVYKDNKNDYVQVDVTDDLRLPALLRAYHLCLPVVMKAIIKEEVLQDKFTNATEQFVNLPCITMDIKGYLSEFHEQDTMSPLMLACYLGQLQNVIWLIRHAAHIDQQQNLSGKSALCFALDGYVDVTRRPLIISIIKSLIASNANLRVHDNNDNTFLHKAALVLTDRDFACVIASIKHNQANFYRKMLDYINKDNDDLISHCARHRQLNKLTHLLTCYPNYIQDFVLSENNEIIANFKQVIAGYDDIEKQVLAKLLTKAKILCQEDIIAIGLVKHNKRGRFCC